VLKIDQQTQYRVGSIEFLGVNTVTREKLLESLPKPGEIFDGTRLDEFFKVSRAILPSDASKDDVNIKRYLHPQPRNQTSEIPRCSQQSVPFLIVLPSCQLPPSNSRTLECMAVRSVLW